MSNGDNSDTSDMSRHLSAIPSAYMLNSRFRRPLAYVVILT